MRHPSRVPSILLAVVLLAAPSALAALAVGRQARPAPARPNPLLTPSPLPFQAPEFDKIRDGDFQPAFEEGIRRQRAEIEKIADNPAPPTFENTLVALEKSGQLLSRVSMIFNGLAGANTDPVLEKVQEREAPKLAAVRDAMLLNGRLFERVEAIYREHARLTLDPESLRLVEYYHQQFVMAGARLSAADKATLEKLNEEDATLSAQFMNRLLAATKAGALVVSDKADLAGLSPAQIEGAAQAAKARGLEHRWVIPLQNTTQQPDLALLTNRAVRHELFEASWTRTEHGDANDTRAIVARLAQLRARKAKLLGYANYAAWKLQDQMAKTPEAVNHFLARLVQPATARARKEAAALQQLIDQQHGGFTLEPWDWSFYAEQIRKAKYSVDENQIKPYFELNRVLVDGVFYAAHQLYGLTFKERHDLPVYQKDVRVFEVFDRTGAPLGLFYGDYFKRDNKSGGAWMDVFVGQSRLLGTKPVIYNVANFTPPAPGQPALLTADDVVTMFHEFGHALHGFFADQEYPSLSGTNVARDFVEFPSQFNEHWAFDPAVLAHYAFNDKTGQPMPKALVDRILAANDFNAGYDMTELLAAAELDMQWHTLPASAPLEHVDAFEQAALEKTHMDLPQVPPRYRSSYFLHIWANGYQAGYYSYLWTEMLADDAFAWFQAHGGLTRANGDHFRATVLSRGNTIDYGVMFRDLTGHAPEIGPMLKYRGLSRP
ncbi:MAG TPA: peptidyl-dipeptidase Dcp [Vicinamibacterales bacterium]|nr:peptidyl-dipeptidase Dcp [Vicinamibacterales bacterium]